MDISIYPRFALIVCISIKICLHKFAITNCVIDFRVIIDRAVTPWDSTLNELDLSPTGMTSEPELSPFVNHIKDNSL